MPQALRSAQAKIPFESILRDTSDMYHGQLREEEKETAGVVTLVPAAG
jgi:hypothetical protein